MKITKGIINKVFPKTNMSNPMIHKDIYAYQGVSTKWIIPKKFQQFDNIAQ